MSLTIHEIITNPSLQIRVISSNPNLSKLVSWAHVCELEDPTEWLGEGDLVMTTGLGIPHEKNDQIRYIQALSKGEIAGLVIGEGMHVPKDITALLEEAGNLGFNVLSMTFEIPFSTVTKFISDYIKDESLAKSYTTMQIYETARLGIKGLGIEQLLSNLEKHIGSKIFLIESATFKPWLSNLSTYYGDKINKLHIQFSKKKSISSSFKRIGLNDEVWMLLKLPTQNEASIIVKKNSWVNHNLLNHIAAVIGIELERARFEYESALRIGAEVFNDLLEQRIPEDYVMDRIKPFNLNLKQSVIFAIRTERPELNMWNEILCRNNIRVLFKKQPNKLLGLIEDWKLLSKISHLLNQSIGYSSTIDNIMRIPEAIRESNLALEFSSKSQNVISYESCSTMPFWLPRNLEVATQTYKNVLGELEEYDLANRANLITSLYAYLKHNKSWLNASKDLHIHKQSLIYRIKKIEEITGRSLSNMDDTAIFWFAIKSAKLIEKI